MIKMFRIKNNKNKYWNREKFHKKTHVLKQQ